MVKWVSEGTSCVNSLYYRPTLIAIFEWRSDEDISGETYQQFRRSYGEPSEFYCEYKWGK